jgi:hypothetical protein
MSNLVDKQKLLDYLRDLGDHPISPINLSKVVESCEFDFHPVPRGFPAKNLSAIDVAQIRPVCLGAATGKACPSVAACGFVSGKEELPCTVLRTTLACQCMSITKGEKILWSPG